MVEVVRDDVTLTEGQKILLRAYIHIAGGNGPKLDAFGIYRPVRYPWSDFEQMLVSDCLKQCYELCK